MIKFSCMLCGEKFSVQDQLSGKRIKCPKCNNISVVPAESPRIKFDCENCGQSIRVLQIHGGKKGQCPRCKSPVVVPSVKTGAGDDSGTVTVVCSMCSEKFRLPKDSKERFTACPACGSNVETSLASEPPEPDSSIPSSADEDEYEDEYEDDSDLPEEDEGPDRRLILAICGGAVVVVVGLIILVTVILRSGSEPMEEPSVSPRQEVADTDSPSKPVASNTQSTGTFTLEPPEQDVAVKAPAGSPTEASDDAQNVDLKLRLQTGQKHDVRIVREDSSLHMNKEGQHNVSYINTTGLRFEVEQVDANGVAWLKVTYLTIHEIAKSARGQTEYDSTKLDTDATYLSGPTFSAMIGRSFVAKVAPEGRTLELDGVDEMFLAIAETIVDTRDEANRKRVAKAMAKGPGESMKRSLERADRERRESRDERVEAKRKRIEQDYRSGKEQVREMVGNVIMPFPDGLVGIGDSWQAPTALLSMRAIDLDDSTYTLRENSQTGTLVDVNMKIKLDDELISGEDGRPGSTRATLAGSYEGSIEIDASSGWMLRKKVTFRCSGRMEIAPTERNSQGMTVPILMESIITVEPME